MNGMITVAKNSNNKDFIRYSYSKGIRNFRFNMDYERQAYDAINEIKSLNLEGIKLFADYQGVKMRVQLEEGFNDLQYSVGDIISFHTSNEAFPYISNYDLVREYVEEGCIISFADDKIEGIIKRVSEKLIYVELTKVEYVLRQNAGCTILGNSIPSPHMTKSICKEIAKSKAIRENLVDWVILSFVESADEINDFINEMHEKGISVMAKIETKKGVDNIDSIGLVVDGFMIGRGDLKNSTKYEYNTYYNTAISKIAKFTSLYNGIGTFFLANYSETLELTKEEINDVLTVKRNKFDYIMLSKEVVNSKFPYETVFKLQELCQN